jgi:hypothetical protein
MVRVTTPSSILGTGTLKALSAEIELLPPAETELLVSAQAGVEGVSVDMTAVVQDERIEHASPR